MSQTLFIPQASPLFSRALEAPQPVRLERAHGGSTRQERYFLNLRQIGVSSSSSLRLGADDLHVFIAVTPPPSLAAVARRLNVTTPGVAQLLRLLELRLGVRLIDRSTHTMPDEGERLAEPSELNVDQIEEIGELLA